MSLVVEQHLFMMDVAKLIEKAASLSLLVTGGELHRTVEQQAIYIKSGRSKTMSSRHLQRLAIDLNFFRRTGENEVLLTYDLDVLKPLGDFWEALSPGKNGWGG